MDKPDSYYEEFTSNSNEDIHIKILKDGDNWDKVESFNPSMSHQFFGEKERVLGYKGLKINLYLTCGTLTPCLTYTYDEKMEEDPTIKPDDINKLMTKQIPNCHRSTETFKSTLANDGIQCFGKMVEQFSGKEENTTYEIYQVTGEELQTDAFQRFNEHLQYLLLFFVDGSSFIDSTDPDWEYILLYKKYRNSEQEYRYQLVGYLTLHNFFSYPDKVRQRISQILILPPFQKQGFGEKLLRATYELAKSNCKIRDVTVEDASDEFQNLRDYVDCRNAMELKDFNKDLIKKQLFNKFQALLKLHLKLNTKQIIRVYEIIGLMLVDKSNPMDGLKYRQSVIKRLMGTLANDKDFNHVKAKQQICSILTEKTILVESEYERLEQCYSGVINKLNRS